MKWLTSFLALCLLSCQVVADEAEIDNDRFQLASTEQQTPVWCWAACIQMSLEYYGISKSQREIVTSAYGQPVINTANFHQMINELNKTYTSSNQRSLVTSALLRVNNNAMGTPDPFVATPEALVSHLKQKKISILALTMRAPNGQLYGHVVVITKVNYRVVNNKVQIEGFTVRDPFPYHLVGNRVSTPYGQAANADGLYTFRNGQAPGRIEAIFLVDKIPL